MSESRVEARALRSAPFFAGLPAEDIDAILEIGSPASFDPGQAMVEQGDQGDGMFIIVEGEAEVDVGGRFHKLGAGDFFGEMALFTSGKRMATVKAVTTVRALKISADGFQSFVLEHPTIALSMLKAIVERLREVEQRIDAWMAS